MTRSNLVVPCHWNYEVLETLAQQNRENATNNIAISDMYGALAGEAIGNGRSPNKVTQLKREEAIRFKEAVHSKGIHFNYLLNNSLPFATKPSMEAVREYTDWIVNDFKPDALVIASLDLMKMVRSFYGEISIHVSTIAGVQTSRDMDKFAEIRPEKIVVHNDTSRDFANLSAVLEHSQKQGIGIEVLCTESCLRKCQYMDAHRDLISAGGDDTSLQCRCNTQKLSNPFEFLRANFIRPEDLEFYEGLGVKNFKISGRSKPAQWLPFVTNAYLERHFEGNLIRLLGIDPSLHAEEWIYVNNSALNGLIKDFPKTGLPEDEERYCTTWAKKLFASGDMRINDFSYDTTGQHITCKGGIEGFRRRFYPKLA